MAARRELLGFVKTNISGIQYYPGRVSDGQSVGLVREPSNSFDPNAIRVDNERAVQVGYIERPMAAVLAPLMDSGSITVEGMVPKSGYPYKIPCKVRIFSSLESTDSLKQSLYDQEIVLHRDVLSVDQIFDNIERGMKKIEMEPVEPPRTLIRSELYKHQKEAVGWMLNKENSEDLPPFWLQDRDDDSYRNVFTDIFTAERPEPLRGGILADDMGLGKTLTLLSLIAFDIYSRSSRREDDDNDSGSSSTSKKLKRDNASLTTLIVCPSSVIKTWTDELKKHTCDGSLRMYTYHGPKRTSTASELSGYDIVLTTYHILSTEHSSWDESPIGNMDWWRVILDEAHTIRNPEAKQSKAAISLKSKRRWAVSGTPIQNHAADLFPIIAFLQIEPFSTKSYWQDLTEGGKNLKRLQILTGLISLARTKESVQINLPSKVVVTRTVDLSTEERDLYKRMEDETKQHIEACVQAGTLTRSYLAVLSLLLRLRQICLSMDLIPAEIKSIILPYDCIQDASTNPALLTKILQVIRYAEESDCPVCISPPAPAEIVITSCGHIFCRDCITKTLRSTANKSCPMCRKTLSESDLFQAPPQSEASSSNQTSTSTKITALVELLKEARDVNPNGKSVVYSQFIKLLVLVEAQLKQAGFQILRIDGSMNPTKRAKVIEDFGTLSGPSILLATLRSSGTGINLAVASTVYLMEPWWNPAVEQQAMDRVHRIGQRQEVRVVRLIANDTIEERVLLLQEKKRKLATVLSGDGDGLDEDGMEEDLRILLSLT